MKAALPKILRAERLFIYMDRSINTLSLPEAALEYAKQGWPVLPLHNPVGDGRCSCGDLNCGSRAGKHPRISGGVKKASADLKVVEKWWQECPNANIGIATGGNSGFVVLDIDTKSNGPQSLDAMIREYGELPQTLRVQTGSGGEHILFQYPGDGITNRTGIRDGVDFKTQGGYIVAAPSVHASGNRYQWSVFDCGIAGMPEWLLSLLREKKASIVAGGTVEEGKIPAGQRNSTLFALACSLRKRGLVDEALYMALKVMNDTQCDPPLDEKELQSIINSAIKYEPGNLSHMRNVAFRQSDLGNAERIVANFGQEFRYCSEWKKFLIWDGNRLVFDNTGEIERFAKRTIRNIYTEAAGLDDDSERKRLLAHALHSECQSRIRAMIESVKTEKSVSIKAENIDADKWVLNCLNGTIDLRSGTIRTNSIQDLITKQVPVEYDEEANCPLWIAFLERIMGGNQELIRFLQKAVGYSLTGSTREQCLFILYGSGSNGKSVFSNTIEALLADYAQKTPTDTLLAKKNESIRNDIARLKGARFVTASEINQGRALDEALIKQMTGGDKLTARFLHGEFFEFLPEFKLFLATNHKPRIQGTDHGIWRRIRLIPFGVTIPQEERDPELEEKLKGELPGILRWAVEGCLLWQKDGLAAPEEVAHATDEYRGEMDGLQDFINSCLVVNDGAKISASELYRVYQAWCEENGEYERSQRILSVQLKDKGFMTKRSGPNGSVVWHGIGKMENRDREVLAGTEELN